MSTSLAERAYTPSSVSHADTLRLGNVSNLTGTFGQNSPPELRDCPYSSFPDTCLKMVERKQFFEDNKRCLRERYVFEDRVVEVTIKDRCIYTSSIGYDENGKPITKCSFPDQNDPTKYMEDLKKRVLAKGITSEQALDNARKSLEPWIKYYNTVRQIKKKRAAEKIAEQAQLRIILPEKAVQVSGISN